MSDQPAKKSHLLLQAISRISLLTISWLMMGSLLLQAATLYKNSVTELDAVDSWLTESGSSTIGELTAEDIAVFGVDTEGSIAFHLHSPLSVAGLQFTTGLNGQTSLNASSHRLSIGASGLAVVEDSQNVVLGLDVELTAAQTWDVALLSRSLIIAGTVSGDSSANLILQGNLGSDHTAGLNPAIGTGNSATPRAFVFEGSTSNTFEGNIVVNNGLVVLRKSNGAVAIQKNIQLNGSSALYLAGNQQLSDTSVLTLTGGAKYILNGYSQTLGGLVSTGATSLVESANGGSASSVLSINTSASTSYHFNGGILRNNTSGTLSVVKSGEGTQIFTGSMAFTGGLTINEGILKILGTGQNNYNGGVYTLTGWKSAINVASGATLQLDHNNSVAVGEILSVAVSGAGQIEKLGAGTIRLSGDNSNHTGSVLITAGTLEVSGSKAIRDTNTISFSTAATAQLSLIDDETVGNLSGGSVAGGHILLGTKTLTLGGNTATATYGGTISGTGSLVKTGSGEQIFSGTNTFTGLAHIQQGTLTVQGGNGLANNGTVRIDNHSTAKLKLASNEVIGRLEGGGSTGGVIDLGIQILTLQEGSFAGVITGSDKGTSVPADQYKFASLIKTGTGTLYLTGTNSTYKGFTEINQGILNVAKIGNVGEAGSLGQRMVENASSDVGLIFRGGTLQYTGSTAESTNRAVRIDINGGAFIDASGSNHNATLSFVRTSSPDFFVSSGSRQLTLTGTNEGNNTWNLSVSQTGSTTTLNKTGTGHWRLTGSHSYTGATHVQAGALLINGTTAATEVSVAAGAKLGGTGTLGGNAIVRGQLSPGGDSSQSNYATGFGIGTLTLGTSSSLAFDGNQASLFLQLGASGQNDKLVFNKTSGLALDLSTQTQLAGSFLGSAIDIKSSVADEDYSKYWIAQLAGTATSHGTFTNSQLKDQTFWSQYLGGGSLGTEWNSAHLVTFGNQSFALFYGANFDTLSLTGGNDLLMIGVIPEPSKVLLMVAGLIGCLIVRRRI